MLPATHFEKMGRWKKIMRSKRNCSTFPAILQDWIGTVLESQKTQVPPRALRSFPP
jgi:hypothetical protein